MKSAFFCVPESIERLTGSWYDIIDDRSVYWGRISPKRYVDTDENCNGGKRVVRERRREKRKRRNRYIYFV